MLTIENKVKTILEQRNMQQLELCHLIKEKYGKCRIPTVCDICNNKSNNFEYLAKIATVLELNNIGDILQFVEVNRREVK